MPTYNLKLNAESIGKILNEVRAYQAKVAAMGNSMTTELTEMGVSFAQQNAAYMNIYDSGELVNGIDSAYKKGKGYVKSEAPHSAFCEFGTGVVGQGSQHPEPAPGWVYDVNAHGEEGWWYYDENGEKRWTKGMPSRPYMYDTAQMLRSRVEETAKELIK